MIETAIRNAFEKGNAEDRAFRERVYRSAFAALDRALKANPQMTVEVAIGRRRNLQAKIAEIESEFIAAVPPDVAVPSVAPPVVSSPAVMSPETVEPGGRAPTIEVAPPVSATARAPEVDVAVDLPVARTPEVSAPHLDPALDAPVATPAFREPVLDGPATTSASASGFDIPAQSEPNVDTERRRPWAMMFVIVTFVALLSIGGWWAYTTGLFSDIDTGVPNPPPAGEGEDFDPGEEDLRPPGEVDPAREWIPVFTTDDPTLVSAPGGTTAEVMEADGGKFLRIRSSTSGAAVIFDVGQGLLERLAGRKVTFDIVARAAEEGQETQISVICNFGELGDCGRKRYAVGITRADYLFEIELPAKQPGSAGTIAITSDIEGKGRAIDIFEIKASISQ